MTSSSACPEFRSRLRHRPLQQSWGGTLIMPAGWLEPIDDSEPEFFGDIAGGDEGKRGPEKRRQVLAYVRQRPEELRSWP